MLFFPLGFMQPIQTRWGISEAPEGEQFKSYQNARNKCSEVVIQKLIKNKTKQKKTAAGACEEKQRMGVGGLRGAEEGL